MKTPKRRHTAATISHQENKVASLIEDVAEFESFKRDLLPQLRAAIKSGKKPAEIMELAKGIAAARVATIAAFETDNKIALAAAKDLLDRVEGKAKETKDIRHSLENVKPEELDAILISKLEESDEA